MSRVLLAYSTVDGQTLRICTRLRNGLQSAGHEATLFQIEDGADCDLAAYDLVVIGGSVRYRKHRPAVHRFIENHLQELEAKPNAFFSVNVEGRKPEYSTPETNQFVQLFLKQTAWKPRLMGVFAGTVDYPRYKFFDKHFVRLIMWLTDGPTDLSQRTEFTNWPEVDRFASRLALIAQQREAASQPTIG